MTDSGSCLYLTTQLPLNLSPGSTDSCNSARLPGLKVTCICVRVLLENSRHVRASGLSFTKLRVVRFRRFARRGEHRFRLSLFVIVRLLRFRFGHELALAFTVQVAA